MTIANVTATLLNAQTGILTAMLPRCARNGRWIVEEFRQLRRAKSPKNKGRKSVSNTE
jgi:hypothetical protein